MANRLKMAKVNAVLTLHQQGWSQRRIAETLDVDRKTVAEYVRQDGSKRATAPPGEAPSGADSKRAKGPPGPEGSGQGGETAEIQAPPEGRSDCEPYRAWIVEQLELGLSAKRIHQDLVAERGFAGSYYSVRRFVRRLRAQSPLPFRRIEVSEKVSGTFSAGLDLARAWGVLPKPQSPALLLRSLVISERPPR